MAVPGAAGAARTLSRAEALASSPRMRIDNGAIHGSIALKGGRIDDVTLARYRETVDPTSPEIVLLSPPGAPNPYFAEYGWVVRRRRPCPCRAPRRSGRRRAAS